MAASLAIALPATAGAAVPDDGGGIELEPIPRDRVSGGIAFPDGDYSGSMGLSGRFSLTVESVTVQWSGEAAGPVEMTVTGGVVDGTWRLDGLASVGVVGVPVVGAAASTWSTEGTMTGAGAGPYTMSSAGGSGETTAVVDVPGVGERRVNESFAIPASSGQLERVLEVCGQIQADWDQQMQAGLSQLPGTVGTIRTYLTLLPVGVSEIQERIDDLLDRVADLASSLGDIDQAIGEIFVIVARAEALLDLIEDADLACDADGRFMRIVTLQLQDVIHTLLRSWGELSESPLDSVFLLRRLLTAGLRAGAIGSGATDPTAAALLEGLAADIAQEAFLEALAADTVNEDRFVELAIIGRTLGITYTAPNGSSVEPDDVCLALGGCP